MQFFFLIWHLKEYFNLNAPLLSNLNVCDQQVKEGENFRSFRRDKKIGKHCREPRSII